MKKRRDDQSCIVWVAGLPLVLRYSVDSLCAMEAQADMPLDELMNHQFNATRLLLWAGMRRDYPGMSVWDVGNLVSRHLQRGGRLEDIIAACAGVLQASGLIAGDAS